MIRGTVVALVSALILATPTTAAAAQRGPLKVERVRRAENKISFTLVTDAGTTFSATDLEVKVNDLVPENVAFTPTGSDASPEEERAARTYRVEVSNPDPAAVVYEIDAKMSAPGGGRVRIQTPFAPENTQGYVLPSGASGIASPALLAVIFCTVALCVASFSAWLRRRRLSPRSRLRWYVEPRGGGTDQCGGPEARKGDRHSPGGP